MRVPVGFVSSSQPFSRKESSFILYIITSTCFGRPSSFGSSGFGGTGGRYRKASIFDESDACSWKSPWVIALSLLLLGSRETLWLRLLDLKAVSAWIWFRVLVFLPFRCFKGLSFR